MTASAIMVKESVAPHTRGHRVDAAYALDAAYAVPYRS